MKEGVRSAMRRFGLIIGKQSGGGKPSATGKEMLADERKVARTRKMSEPAA
jgi:hypothetical protein